MRPNRPSGPALRAGLAACALLAAGGSAVAQIEQLPETSRSQAQVNRLNRDIETHQQLRGITQQQQFETNQLRTQIQTAPSPVLPPPVAPPPIR